MRDLETIAELLKDRRLSVIREATGISVSTLSNIRDRVGKNPLHSTMQKLEDYFDGKPVQKAGK